MCYPSNYCEEADAIPTKDLDFLPSLFHLDIHTSDLRSSVLASTIDWPLPKMQLISQKISPKAPESGHGRGVPKSQVNFTLLQKWSSHCDQFQHIPEKTLLRPALLPISGSLMSRVNVLEMLQVIALSYVWGKNKFLTMTKGNREAL